MKNEFTTIKLCLSYFQKNGFTNLTLTVLNKALSAHKQWVRFPSEDKPPENTASSCIASAGTVSHETRISCKNHVTDTTAFCVLTKNNAGKHPVSVPKKKTNPPNFKKLWEELLPVNKKHPYLLRKKIDISSIPNVLLKQDSQEALCIPFVNYESPKKIAGYVRIFPNGDKANLKGSITKGSFGVLKSSDTDIIYVCEGYADAFHIRNVTGKTTYYTLSVHNFAYIPKMIKNSPHTKVCIVADNDTNKNKSNIGVEKATHIADKHGYFIIIPPCDKNGIGQDVSDIYVSQGIDAVATLLYKPVDSPIEIEFDKKIYVSPHTNLEKTKILTVTLTKHACVALEDFFEKRKGKIDAKGYVALIDVENTQPLYKIISKCPEIEGIQLVFPQRFFSSDVWEIPVTCPAKVVLEMYTKLKLLRNQFMGGAKIETQLLKWNPEYDELHDALSENPHEQKNITVYDDAPEDPDANSGGISEIRKMIASTRVVPQRYAYNIDTQKYVLVETMQEYTHAQIDAQTTETTLPSNKKLYNNKFLPKYETVVYDPREKTIFFRKIAGKTYAYLNAYVPYSAGSAKGDAELFLEHLRYILPNPKEHKTLLQFLAWQVQRPGQKIRWAFVLRGSQGIGKSFIVRVLQKCLDGDAANLPLRLDGTRPFENVKANATLSQLLETHTGWMERKSLIVFEEFSVGNKHFLQSVMPKLKTYITEDSFNMRKMCKEGQSTTNICNFMFITNEYGAIELPEDDRRFFLTSSPAIKKDSLYYKCLHQHLENNLPAIRYLLENVDLSDFDPYRNDYRSEFKKAVIEASKTNVEQQMEQDIYNSDSIFKYEIITALALSSFYETVYKIKTNAKTLNTYLMKILASTPEYSGMNVTPFTNFRHSIRIGHDVKTVSFLVVRNNELWRVRKMEMSDTFCYFLKEFMQKKITELKTIGTEEADILMRSYEIFDVSYGTKKLNKRT